MKDIRQEVPDIKRPPKLGVIGGMGPQATIMFYQLVVDKTHAMTDQDHIETVIVSDTAMPDRTAAILSGQTEEIISRMRLDAKNLEQLGCTVIVVTCNTAHYFLNQIKGDVSIPIIDMVHETVRHLAEQGKNNPVILATDGTVQSGLYQDACIAHGMTPHILPAKEQAIAMSIIYDQIKAGEQGDPALFHQIEQAIAHMGCDCAIIACTELSVYRINHKLPSFYVDAMDVLAEQAVRHCGKQPYID